MVTTFNSQLQAGLAGTQVLLLDAYTRSHEWTANPAQYGITNMTTQACSTTSPANPLQGSSLGCTSASTVAADTSGYFYADDVHPDAAGLPADGATGAGADDRRRMALTHRIPQGGRLGPRRDLL